MTEVTYKRRERKDGMDEFNKTYSQLIKRIERERRYN
jgi:hypothetical protein